mmetsp:Transcript_31341/g.51741  ORF Transcript_31341/g.51741 Transcript_31341/m.51741 type:complete len:326 (-) Transcript_31341:464-1441(-)|eukprot:CAMPEP_0119029510 /NCGR_PEP_ID=MMETSP1176-20130426/40553_1 /TAXON_ID=265551 /ORGANISM="Synedropsis recta cf, Strain CCMP1620" /LENGTH=325 /DNA_ID=CAMNT_0006985857 /DNA_START=45 /DNA_END=1022 /DNA_ORIENTATION=+
MIHSQISPQGSPSTSSTPRQVVRFMDSVDSSFSSNVDQIFRRTIKESTEHEGASLLLKVAGIVSKEMDSEGIDWEDDLRSDPPPLSLVETENIFKSVAHSKDSDTGDSRPRTSFLSLNRIRSVSIDLSDPDIDMDDTSSREGSPTLGFSLGVALVSPMNSPVITRRTPRRKSGIKALMLNKHSEMPTKKMVEAKGTLNGHTLKTILRKKFSWKNYPELEAFLIANREEYLRHSALNYTVQQKQYNNKLTERLLELAADYGYVFDEEAFSFVTVRDRIRCYFKSYVQSAKKRGVIIGYAARKAGLLTDDDLEKSASQSSRIIMPSS